MPQNKKIRKNIICTTLAVCVSLAVQGAGAYGDTFHMKNGMSFEGVIVEDINGSVTVKKTMGHNRYGFSRFKRSDIQKIVKDKEKRAREEVLKAKNDTLEEALGEIRAEIAMLREENLRLAGELAAIKGSPQLPLADGAEETAYEAGYRVGYFNQKAIDGQAVAPDDRRPLPEKYRDLAHRAEVQMGILEGVKTAREDNTKE